MSHHHQVQSEHLASGLLMLRITEMFVIKKQQEGAKGCGVACVLKYKMVCNTVQCLLISDVSLE